MKFKALLSFVLLFCFLFFIGCQEKNPLSSRTVIEYGDNLEDAINEFEDSRTEVSKSISQSTTIVNETLSDDSPNIRQASQDWERDWNNANNEFNHLETTFSTVGTTSKAYFDKLTEIQMGIQNKQLQRSEEKKNKEIKDSWTKAYTEASQSIQNLKAIISDGNDFHKVLLGASLREKLVKNIDELNKISQKSDILLKKLKKLTIEGKKLIVK